VSRPKVRKFPSPDRFAPERSAPPLGVQAGVHRSIVPAAALGAAVLAAGALAAAAVPAPYTVAQAAQGAKVFAAQCSVCHGAHLEGVTGPALLSAQLPGSQTVADVYAVMSTQMPATAPGSLTPAQYAAIMAFLLKANHHPPGTTALTDAKAKVLATPF
jgi:mono/diheme cytochrome c family protein